MEVIAVVSAVVGAIGEYEAGQAQKRMYDLQAKQASVEGERKSIQYNQRANDVLRRQGATNAAIAARAAAGGVDPFSGSADIIRAASDTAAGREFEILLADADAALRGGAIQAQLYEQAGDAAGRAGTFRAVAKLGSAAASASGPSTQSPAPIEDRSVYA